MDKKREYAVDFYLAGTVIITARNKNEAVRKAARTETDMLIGHIENSGFGKNYIDEIE